MPAKSEAQRRFLYARFGKAWAKRHHFANEGRLPQRIGPRLARAAGKKGHR